MGLTDNPYILVMLVSSLTAAMSSLVVAYLNSRNTKRSSSGSTETSDAATIFNQGQQNYAGALNLVKELRTEVDRLVRKIEEQNTLLDLQSKEIVSLRAEIHQITLKLEAGLAQGKGPD